MKIDWIEKGVLAASGIPLGEKDVRALKEHGIAAIITLTEQPLTIQKEITSELLAELGITCLYIPVVDQHPPNADQVKAVAEFITKLQAEGKACLVHCHAGVGRTGTMLHAYYLAQGVSFDDAKLKVKTSRSASQFFMLSKVQQAFLEEILRDRGSN